MSLVHKAEKYVIRTGHHLAPLPLIGSVMEWLNDSGSPNQVKTPSFRAKVAKTVDGGEIEWVEGTAYPEARRWHKWQPKSIIFGLAELSVQMQWERLKKPEGFSQAVAYLFENDIHVGLLPNGFGRLNLNGCNTSVAAMREGKDPIFCGMGFGNRETRQYFALAGVKKEFEPVLVSDLHGIFPEVPLA